MPKFSAESLAKLNTCHPDLQRLFKEVVLAFDCTVVQGVRTEQEQFQLFADGKSKTLQSKHLAQWDGFAHAVDVVPFPVDWEDRERMAAFGGYVLGIAAKQGIPVRWGNAWKYPRNDDISWAIVETSFRDLPHFELVLP